MVEVVRARAHQGLEVEEDMATEAMAMEATPVSVATLEATRAALTVEVRVAVWPVGAAVASVDATAVVVRTAGKGGQEAL